jgi:hypothetical protein
VSPGFDAGDGRLRNAHSTSELLLRQAGPQPRCDQFARDLKLLGARVVLGSHRWVA